VLLPAVLGVAALPGDELPGLRVAGWPALLLLARSVLLLLWTAPAALAGLLAAAAFLPALGVPPLAPRRATAVLALLAGPLLPSVLPFPAVPLPSILPAEPVLPTGSTGVATALAGLALAEPPAAGAFAPLAPSAAPSLPVGRLTAAALGSSGAFAPPTALPGRLAVPLAPIVAHLLFPVLGGPLDVLAAQAVALLAGPASLTPSSGPPAERLARRSTLPRSVLPAPRLPRPSPVS
jgi:hypothetical protein